MNCVIHGPWPPALLPALLDWPVLLYSMHIAFIELIIDPACPQAFENQASEHSAMRCRRVISLDRSTVVSVLAQGMLALLIAAITDRWALTSLPEATARAAGFAVLVMAN